MPKHFLWAIIKTRLNWFEMAKEKNITYACKYFGISRKTFYKWYRRYQESGEDAKSLQDKSRRPKTHPKLTSPEVALLIIKLRKETKYGPRRLAFYLQRDYGITLSICGIWKVLSRAGLITHYKRRKKRFQSYGEYVRYPGHRVQIDTKPLPKRKGQFDSRDYQYVAKDVFTKLRFIKVYQELSVNNTVDFAQRTTKFFPFKIKRIQTDHGVEFTYDMLTSKRIHPLDKFLRKHKIRHSLSPVATPRYNGQVERSIRTDLEEFYRPLGIVKDHTALSEKLLTYLKYYNQHRPHMAINMLTPLQKLHSIPGYENAKLNWRCYL
jgi:transposase